MRTGMWMVILMPSPDHIRPVDLLSGSLWEQTAAQAMLECLYGPWPEPCPGMMHHAPALPITPQSDQATCWEHAM